MVSLADLGLTAQQSAHFPVFRDWDLEALDEDEALAYLGQPTLTAEDVFDEAD